MNSIVPVTDEAGHASWYATMVEAQLHDQPYGDWSTIESSLLWLTRPRTEREPQAWSAVEGGRVVGAAMAHWPLLDNTHLGDFSIGVLPSEQRRGVGSALLDTVTAEAHRRGRSTLFSEVQRPYDGTPSPGGQFLARHGLRRRIRQRCTSRCPSRWPTSCWTAWRPSSPSASPGTG